MVMDNINNIPIVGASIEITGTESGTQSEKDGSFVLNIQEKLPTKIAVTYMGYELKEIMITEATDNLLVSMVPGALVGQEVVVSASRKREKAQEAPSAMDVIEFDELKADAVVNPFLSLRNKVGLDISQTGVNNGHITLRGRSAAFQTETFVMADYRNLILPGLGTISYGQIPVDPIDLEKIEIVKGPGSALYGPGVEAGIIHFISKSPFDQQGTSVSIGAGTRNTLQASLRHAGMSANEKFGYKLTTYYRKSRDWEIDSTDAVEAAHLASFQPRVVSSLTGEVITDVIPDYNVESAGFTGTLAFRPNKETTITAVGGWSIGKSLFRTAQGEGYLRIPRPFGQFRIQSGGLFAQAFWSYQAGGDGTAFLYPTGLTTITKSHQVEGQVQYNFTLEDEKYNLIVGSDYRLNTFDSEGTIHGRWEDQDDYTIAGVYGQAEVKLNKVMDLVGAARVDRFVALKETSFSPRLGLVYKISPKHTMRLTFNRAIGTPTALNLFADLPLANRGAFLLHLLGGADEVTFDQPSTTSFIPGVGQNRGIGTELQPVYNLVTAQLAQLGALPDDLIQYLASVGEQMDGFSPGVLTQEPLTRERLKLSSSNMYEIGYKGLFEDKLGVGIDFYFNNRKNVVSAPFQASPLVVQPTLANDLSGVVMSNLDPEVLAQYNLSPEAVAGIYGNVAQAIAFNSDTGQPNVLGLIRADQTPTNSPLPTVDLAYYNIREISYFGLDVALKYYFTGDFSVYGNLSWLSQSYFEDVPVGGGDGSPTTDFSLNVPDTKVKFGVELYPEYGLNGFAMLRYQNAWNSVNGVPWTGPVDAFLVTDLGLGYTFDNNLSINGTITNLLQEEYRAFYGAPKIGRQFIAKMYYQF
ncbi:TonB-dependent receptor [Flavilitoribacter nigricans]|nr:TonB-dependent receptor [Flavilitoribacter nigricans]